MKSLKYLISLALVASILMDCSSPSGPTTSPQDDQLKKLAGKAWKATAVSFKSGTAAPTDESSSYSSFVIQMTGTKGADPFDYSTTGRPTTSPWPASGTFTFSTTDFANVMSRDDKNGANGTTLPVTYTVTDKELQMTFTFASSTGFSARTSQVQGQWVFTFGL